MPLLPIIHYDHPVLREPARAIEAIADRHRQLARDMAETMYASNGIGLAANQVAQAERLIVVDIDWPESRAGRKGTGRRNPLILLNPEVIGESAWDEASTEGCLSLPGLEGTVWRPTAIRYRWLGLDGHLHEAEAEGLLARCLQHEIDHLNGILFIDRMPNDERQALAGALATLRRQPQPIDAIDAADQPIAL